MYFKSNQEYFADTLCIQKEILDNTCQGSCQLRKIIQEAEEQEKKSMILLDKYETLFFEIQQVATLHQKPELLNRQSLASFYLSFKPSSFIAEIFHPPQSI